MDRAPEPMRTKPASDSSLLVSFGSTVSESSFRSVLALFGALQDLADPRITNLHPAYATLLIDFDPLTTTHDEIVEIVGAAQRSGHEIVPHEPIEIPVCYEPEFGPDLAFVSDFTGLPVEEVIRAHHSRRYTVHFLGFSPGFAYLGGLEQRLSAPRLATPRKVVAAGSVGIAGNQTGVYPISSPGGWRLIGRTPLTMFDPDSTPPTRLQPGDKVRFVPIDREEFDRIASATGRRP